MLRAPDTQRSPTGSGYVLNTTRPGNKRGPTWTIHGLRGNGALYSPDLASSDYHLFPAMAHLLQSQKFISLEEDEAGVQRSLGLKGF